MSKELKLRIFTLNCWGIPIISKNRRCRFNAIADHLRTENYDFVCLQEVWSENDFNTLKQKVCDVLPHAFYFHSGVVGSGLCIFSRYPVTDVLFHQYAVNGYMHKVFHADWFAGKGIGLCRIKVDDVMVNVYIAHLHAEYNPNDDEYLAHRVIQAYYTAQFVRLTSSSGDIVLFGADLNSQPGDLPYRIISQYAELQDTCKIAQNSDTNVVFGTNETASNSYTCKKAARNQPDGKRIDHILFKTCSKVKVSNVFYKHPLPSRIPGQNCSYSDHEGVSATFVMSHSSTDVKSSADVGPLLEGIEICKNFVQKLRYRRFYYCLVSIFLFLAIIAAVAIEVSYPFGKVVNIGVAVVSVLLSFTMFMAIFWNSMEVKGVCAGIEEMSAASNSGHCGS